MKTVGADKAESTTATKSAASSTSAATLAPCSLPGCGGTRARRCSCRTAAYCSPACQVAPAVIATCHPLPSPPATLYHRHLRHLHPPPQRADWARHRPRCPPFTCAMVAAKGRGLVATRRLHPGSTVLKEAPILALPLLGPQATRELLLATFHQLSPGRREALLAIPGTQLPGDEELVTRLARIVDVYSIRSVEGQGVRRNLYQQASLINHSCEPNMVWYPLQGHIVVRVVREVARSEELTVSYIPTHLAAYTRGTACPTLQQRRALLAPYRFTCACRLCSEGGPAEEGAREVFQVLDRELEAAASLNHQLEIARRKLEVAERIGGQCVFLALVDCWKLTELVEGEEGGEELRARAARMAEMLGPEAQEVMARMAAVSTKP